MVPLDKRILEQYIDACAQVKETEAELEKIRRAKKILQVNIISYRPPKICFIFKVRVLKNMNIEF